MSNRFESGVSKKYEWKNIGHQLYAAFAANLMLFGHGMIIGWLSPALSKLTDESTPLQTGPLTNEQVSWMGSVGAIGALFGCLSTGYIITLFGCKRTMIFLTVPMILFWILIHFGNTYYQILIGRIFSGFSGGGLMLALILYVTEIANDNIRGRLGSFGNLLRNIGILFSYSIGAVLNYEYLAPIYIVLQILITIIFVFLPNTPQFYIKRGQLQNAEESLKYYKGFKGETQKEISEFKKEFERLQKVDKGQKDDEKLCFSDFFEKQAIKAIIAGIVIATINQLTGCFTFVSYAILIFDETGSSVDPYASSIIMGVMQLIGNLCTARLADSFDRKTLSIISLVGSAVGNGTFAIYMYLHLNGVDLSAFQWIPVISISFVMFIASAGFIPLGPLFVVENLPTKVRGIGLVICIITLNLSAFFCVKFFPILIKIIGLHGCLVIFAVSCLLGSIFVFFVMNETRGRSMDASNE